MKNPLIAWLLVLVSVVLFGQEKSEAQTKVSIQTKKLVVRHSKKDPAYHGNTLIRYPLLLGLRDVSLLKHLQKAAMPQGVYKGSLAELKKDDWLDEVEYTVNCNQNSVLDITYLLSGQAAYPDSFEEYVTVNLKTGKRTGVGDLFIVSSLPKLAAQIDQAMQADKRKAIQTADKETQEEIRQLLSAVTFKHKDLAKFTISPRGVTFHYHFGFPHVIKALEPEGHYFLPYSALKQFVRRDGLLNAFLR